MYSILDLQREFNNQLIAGVQNENLDSRTLPDARSSWSNRKPPSDKNIISKELIFAWYLGTWQMKPRNCFFQKGIAEHRKQHTQSIIRFHLLVRTTNFAFYCQVTSQDVILKTVHNSQGVAIGIGTVSTHLQVLRNNKIILGSTFLSEHRKRITRNL